MISRFSVMWTLVLVALCAFAHAAPTVETYSVNLDPLIDKAAGHPAQFAVSVARRVDSERNGHWQIDGAHAVWDYAIRIPEAVTMGFHASRLILPADGTLSISGGGHSFVIRGADLHHEDYWSRIVKGDRIDVRITVPAAKRHQALMEVAAFQAGYKSLVPGTPDNAHYKAMRAHTSDASSGCVQNFVCDASASTQSAANASVALLISNQFECSGTLLNDVPQDGTPYVLTARHCQGEAGGGNPGAAGSVEVFWNAVTPCGQPLESIFDSASQVQFGASTVVEQEDQWLIRLDGLPSYPGVYYAGWDASGAALNGGYSIDYGLAESQQYVTWAGDAITQTFTAQNLGVGYDSTYWGVVNSLGSTDHGASGSALFNANNLVVGSQSRAVVEQCPVSPPPAPSANAVVALVSKLASTWNSTADASSTTGSATLASVLDPGNTGTTTLVGVAGTPVTDTLQTSQATQQVNGDIFLYYTSSTGAVCTATGGTAGDGWAGTLGSYAGNVPVIETMVGTVTYGITCVSGARSRSAQVSVTWTQAPPALTFNVAQYEGGFAPGTPITLAWQSNQSSCVASGGAAGDGWGGSLAGSGQLAVTETQPGTYSYTVTCGTGSEAVSQSLTDTLRPNTASLSLETSPGLRYGQLITLNWNGLGNCTASGGGAGDGWAGSLSNTSEFVFLSEKAPGTYTYKISCGPAAVAAVAQVSYTFSADPAKATLTVAQPTELINLATEEIPDLLKWTANVAPCGIDYAGPVSGTDFTGYLPQGTDTNTQQIAGLYTYTLTCGTGSAQTTSSATIEWQQQPSPQVSLTTAHGSEFPLSGGYLEWNTNVLPCVGSGGAAGDGWSGTKPYYNGTSTGGDQLMTESAPGTYTFTITCGVGVTAAAQTTAVFNGVGGSVLTLTPGTGPFQVVDGQPTYMTWNSAVGPCTGYGGTSTDGWNGSHPQQGSASVVESGQGQYTLSLVCGVDTSAVEVQFQIDDFGPATDVGAQIFASSNTTVQTGKMVTLQWTGGQAASCTATGGAAGDGWTGTLPWYGSQAVTETHGGSVTYGLTCQNGSLSAQDSATVVWSQPPASVKLSSSTTTGVLGTPLTLNWSTANGATACTASEDGGQTGAWSGSVGDSGSQSIQETSGSAHTYAITCTGASGTVDANVTVNFAPATSSGGSGSGGGSGSSGSGSSGGSGSGSGSESGGGTSTGATSGGKSGGGAMEPWMIGALSVLVALRANSGRRGRRTPRGADPRHRDDRLTQ